MSDDQVIALLNESAAEALADGIISYGGRVGATDDPVERRVVIAFAAGVLMRAGGQESTTNRAVNWIAGVDQKYIDHVWNKVHDHSSE